MTDKQKEKAALAILEQVHGMDTRINGLRCTMNHLKQLDESLTRKHVHRTSRTQQHYCKILDELQRMIDEQEECKQCIVDVINSIIESSKFEKGSRIYLTLRYVEGLTHEATAERMHLSADHLKRKRAKALLLFADALESMDTDALTQTSRTTHTKQQF